MGCPSAVRTQDRQRAGQARTCEKANWLIVCVLRRVHMFFISDNVCGCMSNCRSNKYYFVATLFEHPFLYSCRLVVQAIFYVFTSDIVDPSVFPMYRA